MTPIDMSNPANRLVWTDIETPGLVKERDPIIEIGFTITTLNLEPVASFAALIWTPQHDERYRNLMEEADRDEDAAFVVSMHMKNNLFAEAMGKGLSWKAAELELHTFLDDNGIHGAVDPLCGSSVQFDRERIEYWLPEVGKRFSYRNIDVSTLKELCLRYNAEMYRYLPQDVKPQKLHRVLPDLQDSISEFTWYRDNFLFEAPMAE